MSTSENSPLEMQITQRMANHYYIGNQSAAESPFGGMKESGYGKESGKEVAVNEYLVTKTGTLTIEGQY